MVKDFKSNHFLFSNDDLVKIIYSLKFKNIKFLEIKYLNLDFSYIIYNIKIKNIFKSIINISKNFKFYLKKKV